MRSIQNISMYGLTDYRRRCLLQQIQIALSALFFVTGIAIYLLFRSRDHLGFMLADAVGLGSVVDSLRAMTAGTSTPDSVRYSLPDGLWSASYILLMDAVHRRSRKPTRLAMVSLIPAFGIVSEIMQLYGFLPGVYDPLDIIAYSLPLIIYCGFTHYNNQKH